MLHLITGANGAGKTLFTLKWVMERAEKEGRPVCHNGRFAPKANGPLANWKKIDFNDWQSEPDGTIFLIDECHNDLPVRPASQQPSDAVKMLAEHRRRGMDFYLITQHPQNIDAFVRRLIGSPGWHRHLKRTFGANMVSCIEWDAVNPNCEKAGSGKSGQVTMKSYPVEVFEWYDSASIHTGKKKVPKALYVVGACLVLVPVLFYFAFSAVTKGVKGGETAPSPQPDVKNVVIEKKEFKTTAEYVEVRKPRLPDFPHTAPVYDEVTKPTEAPYPAACIQNSKKCTCYSQQGTVLNSVSFAICEQIVKNGFFVDWKTNVEATKQKPIQNNNDIVSKKNDKEVSPPVIQEPVINTIDFSQGLAARNAQVRSNNIKQ